MPVRVWVDVGGVPEPCEAGRARGQEPAACGLLAGLACSPQGQGQEGVACGRTWLANWL